MEPKEWDSIKCKLEQECLCLKKENEGLHGQLAGAKEEQVLQIQDRIAKNDALLSGREILLQHMEIAALVEEREAARCRNPLFW